MADSIYYKDYNKMGRTSKIFCNYINSKGNISRGSFFGKKPFISSIQNIPSSKFVKSILILDLK